MTKPRSPRVYRAQKVVADLQRETRPAFTARGTILEGPKQLVEDTLADYLSDRATEVFLVLYVSVRNAVIGFTEFTSGSVSGVEVHPAGIMRDALLVGAAAMVTVHNHPSGDATPSAEDRELWKRLREVGLIMGVPVVDNLVVGDGQFFSEEEGRTQGFSRERTST